MTTEKKGLSAQTLYKIFIYVVLITLAVLIIVPVAWVFLASVKQNSEFYGNPWTLPAAFYWQNFVDAWTAAKMGEYMLNSVTVTALALGILLVVALPAAYCLSRFKFWGSKALNVCFMAGLFKGFGTLAQQAKTDFRRPRRKSVLSICGNKCTLAS